MIVFQKVYTELYNHFYYVHNYNTRTLRCYCPNCKSVFHLHSPDFIVGNNSIATFTDNSTSIFEPDMEKTEMYACPLCEEPFNGRLSRIDCRDLYSHQPGLVTIFEDEDGISFVCFMKFINIFNDRLVTKSYRVRWTFNTKTGHSYYFGPRNEAGKPIALKTTNRVLKKKVIQNCSYNVKEEFSTNIFDSDPTLLIALEKALCDKLIKDVPGFDNRFHRLADKDMPHYQKTRPEIVHPLEGLHFSAMAYFGRINRWPHLDQFTAMKMAELFNKNNYNIVTRYSFLPQIPREIKEDEAVNRIIGILNIPRKKQLKRLIAENMDRGVYCKALSLCGLTNYDHIMKLLPVISDNRTLAIYLGGRCHRKKLKPVDLEAMDPVFSFIYHYLPIAGEQKTVHTILNNHRYDIDDVGRSLARIFIGNGSSGHMAENKEVIEKAMEKSFYRNKKFKQIHDDLAILAREVVKANNVFSYSDKTLALEETIVYRGRTYAFSLPKDSRSLTLVGSEMNHCVGGYDHDISTGRTTIVTLTIDGKLDTCMSLTGNRLHQVKRKHNGFVEDMDTYEAIKSWAESKKIDHSSSMDLQKPTLGIQPMNDFEPLLRLGA